MTSNPPQDDQAQGNDVNLEDLQEKIKALEKEQAEAPAAENAPKGFDQTEELKNALARALADLQNYKRRTEEDRGKFFKMANAELLLMLIPVFDNFHRSATHLPEDLKGNEWVKGVMHIHDDFQKILEKAGVTRVLTVGQKLDTNQHEALMAGPGEKDMVVEEFEPGYLYKGDVLKPAKVKVGDGTSAS